MYLIAIAWGYVALMMALAEATSSQGSILGAIITLVLYGVLPITIVLYLLGTPHRKKARQRQEQLELAATLAAATSSQTDSGDHAPTDPLTPVGKKA
jgi:mannose/fructose/N-acetylgalactosamine-specific phosphotransferase system component IID